MRKKKDKPNAVPMAEVRAELEEEYGRAFGCPWDATPWGTPWPDVVREAMEADREFRYYTKLIERFVSAVDALESHARDARMVPGKDSLDPARASGRTWPEIAVLGLMTKDGAATLKLRDRGRDLVATFRTKAESVDRGAARGRTREVAAQAFAQEVREFPPDAEMLARTREAYRVHANRRVRPMTLDLVYSGFEGSSTTGRGELATLFVDPPSDAKDGPDWRRAFLVQLLDVFPMRIANVFGGVSYPTNREIAVVSLLLGGLNELAQSERETRRQIAQRGTESVVRVEQKAIREARGRRTYYSRVLGAMGVGGDIETAHRRLMADDGDPAAPLLKKQKARRRRGPRAGAPRQRG